MAAAGSIAIGNVEVFGHKNYRRYVLPFTTHASTGNVAEIPLTFPAGDLVLLDFIPGATTPTTGCSLLLEDASGVDVLTGQGAAIDTSKTRRFTFTPPVPFQGGTLTATLTNAGNSKNGQIIVTLLA